MFEYRIFKKFCNNVELTDNDFNMLVEALFTQSEVDAVTIVAIKDIISILPVTADGTAVNTPFVFINRTSIEPPQTLELLADNYRD